MSYQSLRNPVKNHALCAPRADSRLYDFVTKLPSYSHFLQLAQQQITESPNGTLFAVAYMDILNFKSLNEHYGMSEGDRQLSAFADHLRHFPAIRTATRVFSDLFIILLTWEPGLSDEAMIQRHTTSLKLFLQDQRSYHPKCTIEIICGFCKLQAGDDLLQSIDNANCARKLSRTQYTTNCLIFDEQMARDRLEQQQLIVDIKNALNNRQFFFALQPKIDLHTGHIVGAEALARWTREDGTAVPPGQFIPLMERDGSIVDLDFQIYQLVCQYLSRCLSVGLPVVPISLNISRVHLKNRNFAHQLHQLVQAYHIPPELLEWELTETIFLDALDAAKQIIAQLHDYGYKISMDDFGSGFSSLNLLQEIDFDILKLDRGFLSPLEFDNARNSVVVSSIIQMAKKLSITVLCEGVESLEQTELVRNLGCDVAQGYYFSHPMDLPSFDMALKDGIYNVSQISVPNDLNNSSSSILHHFDSTNLDIDLTTDSLPCGVSLYKITPEGLRIVQANPSAYHFMGLLPHSINLQTESLYAEQYIFPEYQQQFRQQLTRLTNNGDSVSFQMPYRNANGNPIWFQTDAQLLATSDGQRLVRAVTTNISRQKQTERHLKDELDFYKRLCNTSLCGIIQFRKYGQQLQLIHSSQHTATMLTYADLDDFFAHSASGLLETIHPDDRQQFLSLCSSLHEMGDSVQFLLRLLSPNSPSILWINGIIEVGMAFDGEPAFQCSFVDCTHLKESEGR